jgi:hypothetical protein
MKFRHVRISRFYNFIQFQTRLITDSKKDISEIRRSRFGGYSLGGSGRQSRSGDGVIETGKSVGSNGDDELKITVLKTTVTDSAG